MPDPDVQRARVGDTRTVPGCGHSGSLLVNWLGRHAVVNVRGDPGDPAFRESIRSVLGAELPLAPNRTTCCRSLRIVWVGPDDWFVIDSQGEAGTRIDALRNALAGQHVALTDVSSGYKLLRLEGPPVRDVLAQGCPLDLHPREFGPDRCAGSHYFKASVWLWRIDAGPTFELLVRRSFAGYVHAMLERATGECGMEVRSERASD